MLRCAWRARPFLILTLKRSLILLNTRNILLSCIIASVNPAIAATQSRSISSTTESNVSGMDVKNFRLGMSEKEIRSMYSIISKDHHCKTTESVYQIINTVSQLTLDCSEESVKVGSILTLKTRPIISVKVEFGATTGKSQYIKYRVHTLPSEKYTFESFMAAVKKKYGEPHASGAIGNYGFIWASTPFKNISTNEFDDDNFYTNLGQSLYFEMYGTNELVTDYFFLLKDHEAGIKDIENFDSKKKEALEKLRSNTPKL